LEEGSAGGSPPDVRVSSGLDRDDERGEDEDDARERDEWREGDRHGEWARRRHPMTWSAVDGGHVRLLVAIAGGRGEIVQPCDLLHAQLDAVGGRVLFDAGDALGAGDRGNIVTLREQPRQRDLRRCGVDLGSDGFDLVDDADVLLEVALGEARVALAPVVVGELLGGADVACEEAVPSGE
jgi:hypothetical protein